MHARWVLEHPSPELPTVGQAIGASWWPGRYYWVSTVQLDPSNPLMQLVAKSKSIMTGEPMVPASEKFVTNVYRCDREGWVPEKEYGQPLYERMYENLGAAKHGHAQAVALLTQGVLKMKKIKRFS